MFIDVLNQNECGELLKQQGFGTLGCASKNQPYIVPTYFAYEPDRLFGFSATGQKIEWMRSNPLVCVNACEVVSHDNWISVSVFGRYEELTNDPEHAELRLHAHSLIQKRSLSWQIAIQSSQTRRKLFGDCPVFYCIRIDEMTGQRASPGQTQ